MLKMFRQVRCDQDALHFLWWTNNYDDPPHVYVMQAHIFGPASSPSVANSVLRRTATDNVEDFDKEVVSTIKQNFYVDDSLPSAEDSPSAIRLASGMMDILTRGGFRLTKFMSNSRGTERNPRYKPVVDAHICAPCGHTFCGTCIEVLKSSGQVGKYQMCREGITLLCKNRFAEIVECEWNVPFLPGVPLEQFLQAREELPTHTSAVQMLFCLLSMKRTWKA